MKGGGERMREDILKQCENYPSVLSCHFYFEQKYVPQYSVIILFAIVYFIIPWVIYLMRIVIYKRIYNQKSVAEWIKIIFERVFRLNTNKVRPLNGNEPYHLGKGFSINLLAASAHQESVIKSPIGKNNKKKTVVSPSVYKKSPRAQFRAAELYKSAPNDLKPFNYSGVDVLGKKTTVKKNNYSGIIKDKNVFKEVQLQVRSRTSLSKISSERDLDRISQCTRQKNNIEESQILEIRNEITKATKKQLSQGGSQKSLIMLENAEKDLEKQKRDEDVSKAWGQGRKNENITYDFKESYQLQKTKQKDDEKNVKSKLKNITKNQEKSDYRQNYLDSNNEKNANILEISDYPQSDLNSETSHPNTNKIDSQILSKTDKNSKKVNRPSYKSDKNKQLFQSINNDTTNYDNLSHFGNKKILNIDDSLDEQSQKNETENRLISTEKNMAGDRISIHSSDSKRDESFESSNSEQ